MAKRYDWLRYCYPDDRPPAFAKFGFAPDPSSSAFAYIKESLLCTRELSEVSCYVLLGEPGMGKSDTFLADYEFAKKRLAGASTSVEYRRFTDLGGEASILQFFGSGLIQTWRQSDYELILFLDGLDEGMLLAESWPSLLLNALQEFPRERLKLRLSCRPAIWPDALEDGLRRMFKVEDLPVYSLAPLSEEHVRTAAKEEEIDADEFLTEVQRKSAVPFATKPLSLVFLLQSYKDSRALPPTHVQLFQENCLRLCEEANRLRLQMGRGGTLSPQRRFEIAKTIAAFSLFCNRQFVAKTVLETAGKFESQALDYRLLAPVLPPGTTFSEFREVLDTGLFTARGEQLLGWSQQMFGEFLAALAVQDLNFRVSDLWSLTTVDDGESEQVVPQLYTVAAWLSELSPGYRSALLENHPSALLNADETALDDKVRSQLASRLLEEIEAGVPSHQLHSQFHKLRHPHLDRQLQPHLERGANSFAVRYAAIEIAESCKVTGVEKTLLKIAFDKTEPIALRSTATYAISQYGSTESQKSLRPFVVGEHPEDDHDELKGWSLHAVWPEHLSPDELLKVLTPPKRENFLGGYGMFLYNFSRTLGTQFPIEALPDALKWAAVNDSEATRKLSHVSDGFVLSAWNNLDKVAIAEGLSALILARTKHFREIIANHDGLSGNPSFEKLAQDEPEKRHLLVRTLVPKAASAGVPPHHFFRTALFSSDDSVVYMDIYRNTTNGQLRQWVIELLSLLPLTPAYSEAVRPAIESNELPSALFEKFFIEFGSSAAAAQKANYELEQEFAREPRKPLSPSANEQIESRLKQSEAGDVNAWDILTRRELLLVGEYEDDYADSIDSDLTGSPGWQNSDEGTKARILEAAKKFVLAAKAYPLTFVATPDVPYWAMAEFLGLSLILKTGLWPNLMGAADSATWQRWSIVAVWYPFGSQGRDLQEQLITQLSMRQADFIAASETLLQLMKSAESCHGIPERLFKGWSPQLGRLVLDLAAKTALPPSCEGQLLELSCERDEGAAAFIAEKLTAAVAEEASNGTTKDIVKWARILLESKPELFWSSVWASLSDAARNSLLRGIASFGDNRALTKASDQAVSDVYLFLERRYPHQTDPQHDGGVYSVGDREAIMYLRDSALNLMVARGFVSGIDEAIQEFGYEWLKQRRIGALKSRRQQAWIPTAPSKMISLIMERQKDVLENPYLQFTVGILGNLAASLIYPEKLTRIEHTALGILVTLSILFAINFNKIRRAYRVAFWPIVGTLAIGWMLEAAYLLVTR